MKGLAFEVKCLHCGSETEWLTGTEPALTRTAAMVKCAAPGCRREALVRVVMEPAAMPQALRRRELRATA